jgi:hypothetical protein
VKKASHAQPWEPAGTVGRILRDQDPTTFTTRTRGSQLVAETVTGYFLQNFFTEITQDFFQIVFTMSQFFSPSWPTIAQSLSR